MLQLGDAAIMERREHSAPECLHLASLFPSDLFCFLSLLVKIHGTFSAFHPLSPSLSLLFYACKCHFYFLLYSLVISLLPPSRLSRFLSLALELFSFSNETSLQIKRISSSLLSRIKVQLLSKVLDGVITQVCEVGERRDRDCFVRTHARHPLWLSLSRFDLLFLASKVSPCTLLFCFSHSLLHPHLVLQKVKK